MDSELDDEMVSEIEQRKRVPLGSRVLAFVGSILFGIYVLMRLTMTRTFSSLVPLLVIMGAIQIWLLVMKKANPAKPPDPNEQVKLLEDEEKLHAAIERTTQEPPEVPRRLMSSRVEAYGDGANDPFDRAYPNEGLDMQEPVVQTASWSRREGSPTLMERAGAIYGRLSRLQRYLLYNISLGLLALFVWIASQLDLPELGLTLLLVFVIISMIWRGLAFVKWNLDR